MQETLVQFPVGKIHWRKNRLPIPVLASLVAQLVKDPPAIQEALGSTPGLGRSPGEGKGYLLQYSGLENSMEKSLGSQRVGYDSKFHFHFVLSTNHSSEHIHKQ